MTALPPSMDPPTDPLPSRPFPQRVSSVNREAVVYNQEPSRDKKMPRPNDFLQQNGHASEKAVNDEFGPFDEKLLHPRGGVPDSPILGRLRSADPPPASQTGQIWSLGPGSTASSSNKPSKLDSEALAQLQVPSADRSDVLETELNVVDDPNSWDVINPNTRTAREWDQQLYSLERRAEELYSADHLHVILEDTEFHTKFSSFLRNYRPWRLPLLAYYWDALKALRALEYHNSLTRLLSQKTPPGLHIGGIHPPGLTNNTQLREAAQAAFDELLREDLHWYIANTYIDIVRAVMQSRITGTLPAPLREASHGLAEVFCITDPTRQDNPIILASPAFTRHSGCNMDYILGRNCRFMQGPGTTVDSCQRFAESMKERRDHSEIFVNYRRDGSPFLALVMNAQLLDSDGNMRYYLGAQVDVSGLLKNCSGMDSLVKLIEHGSHHDRRNQNLSSTDPATDIQPLSQMLSGSELDTIGKYGGVLHKSVEDQELQSKTPRKTAFTPNRVILADGSDDSDQGEIMSSRPQQQQQQQQSNEANGETHPAGIPPQEINLSLVYKNYLIIRPVPSLRVLFASPTLRLPGMVQSHFLHHIGGDRMRSDLNTSFQDAQVVTARVRWLSSPNEEGEGEGAWRWIHCTPLMHHTGNVGLWMVVMVLPSNDEAAGSVTSSKSSRSRSQMGQGRSDDGSSVQSHVVRAKPRYTRPVR
ncbi:hypothetical protein M409DRAFT_70658 [Zasmidium cellare ATCC 36951]|uniref:PAS domain-containing protein n=1 Tax=Zasmidium cellare ATCC 36951 TaxID=1080233 RepID=A0A6A6BZT7_ZASCE|nr:uncharacterized protein M409DRAFT_70658 [Zasmidium cellare ATCC 36951]KAF2160133.1 hypothetical protein M409DRAFT_70658 [Zasmidium cellare ATCC 36951]